MHIWLQAIAFGQTPPKTIWTGEAFLPPTFEHLTGVLRIDHYGHSCSNKRLRTQGHDGYRDNGAHPRRVAAIISPFVTVSGSISDREWMMLERADATSCRQEPSS